MEYVVLYRQSRDTMDAAELAAAHTSFRSVPLRTQVPSGSVAIGRYSVLPFYRELEADLSERGASLINSAAQHRYVADVSSWYPDLAGLTPETWLAWEDIPDDVGALVVKGRTNSRKFSWKTHMFAENKRAASEVAWRLLEDAVVGDQDLCFRRYVPLRTYHLGLQGLPITEEYRFFVCDGELLCGAYYWSGHRDDIDDEPDPGRVPRAFLADVLGRVGKRVRFYVVDVGITAEGQPIVIELNDGQMSGLSDNDPVRLYSRLREVLER
jgi:hypothetical protein